MKTQQQLIDGIVEQLQKTEFYEDKHIQWVEAAFDDSWYGDLEPHIRVEDNGYRLQLYERGTQIMDKPIGPEREADVMYWILDSCIQTGAYMELLRRHGVDPRQTSLQMTKEIQAEWAEIIRRAFASIGGVYEEFYRSGRRGDLEEM